MKKSKSISALLTIAACCIFFSCHKSSSAPTYTITGLWKGTYTANNAPSAGSLYYSFSLNVDNTIFEQGKGADGNTYYASGTWTLSGTSFSATIKTVNGSQNGVVQNLTATYNGAGGTLSNGVWTDIYDSGTFQMSQVK